MTIDVKSLYTNIPHNEGIKACHLAFLQLEKLNPQQPPAEILTDLLEIVLKNNTFEFNDLYFKQIHGTAMGTKLAPAYANTFMGHLENQFLQNEPHKPTYYRRFIDDIFMIWPHSTNDLHAFMNHMNSIHPSMQFTFEFSAESITFLDTDVHINSNTLYVTTHIKKTNKQAYTHASSYHPPGTGKGIAIGEAKRYARTNTRVSDYKNCIDKHINQMKMRGYTSNKFLNLIKSVSHSNRFDNSNIKTFNSNRPVFVTRYTATAAAIIKTIRKHWHHLKEDKAVGKYFPNYPIMAFTKNKCLANHLVRAKITNNSIPTEPIESRLDIEHNQPPEIPTINPTNIPINYISPCAIRSCFLHKYLNKSLNIRSSVTGRSFRVRGKLTCNSKNIIYLMQCKKCHKQYIGQTRTCLRHRISQHINNKHSSNSTVDQHFCQPGHTPLIQPIEQIQIQPGEPTSLIQNKLNERESHWMNKLKTVYPQGLNWTSYRTNRTTST